MVQGYAAGTLLTVALWRQERNTKITTVSGATAKGIEVTSRALEQIRKGLAQHGIAESGGLRAAIQGGGCAGLSFAFSFENKSQPHDRITAVDGIRVFIEPKSFIFLYGMTLDYEQGLAGPTFVFKSHKNDGNGCGCAAPARSSQ
jgi:iron-sulfur cluster assembly protein